MARLVNELLEFSHLSRLELNLAPVSLSGSVTNVLTQMQAEIRTREARIEVTGPSPVVRASPTLLESVLTNLLSNALKFVAPEVQPRVEIATETRSRVVRVWVRDNGIGIAPEFQEQIFGVFQRLHSQEAYEGTGIGLAIVKKTVERMGGTVGVESQAGNGSAFWFELPSEESMDKMEEYGRF